ncbi:MAG: phosphate acyltransferase PlsX, partial [Acidobacteriaceae bacterium]
MLIDIALDAMGSDKSPEPEIRGAILACRQLEVRVHLVGPERTLRPLLAKQMRRVGARHLPIKIVQ